MLPPDMQQQLQQWLQQADGLLITAGAGMGVDSGLPDFRGHKVLRACYNLCHENPQAAT